MKSLKQNIPLSNDIPPDNLLPWLTYTEMLTDKLYKLSQNTSLKLLKQEVVNCNWWDKYVLGIINDKALHRQIEVLALDVPCWYARTIIPMKTYTNHEKLFVRLNKETLGDLIFGNNGIERSYLRYYAIDKNNIEYHWLDSKLLGINQKLWARLSRFTIKDDDFYLYEVFLPGLEKYT